MLKVKFTNYINDFTKYREEKNFLSLIDLKNYLKTETERRCPSRSSAWWQNPCDTYVDNKNTIHGWFKARGRDGRTYSLWLDEIKTDDGVIVFETNHYCSPKVYEFLKELHDEFEIKPVYGDL